MAFCGTFSVFNGGFSTTAPTTKTISSGAANEAAFTNVLPAASLAGAYAGPAAAAPKTGSGPETISKTANVMATGITAATQVTGPATVVRCICSVGRSTELRKVLLPAVWFLATTTTATAGSGTNFGCVSAFGAANLSLSRSSKTTASVFVTANGVSISACLSRSAISATGRTAD